MDGATLAAHRDAIYSRRMLARLLITPSWIVSLHARRFYTISAVFAVLLLPTVFVLVATNTFRPDLASELRLLAQILLVPLVAGAAILWVAMWYFWFSFDDSSAGNRTIWFFVMFGLAWIGAQLYFWVVYRAATRKESSSTMNATAASC
jgi:hypothetical protein